MARNGLDPLQVSQLHADAVFLFVGLTVGLLFAVRASGARLGAQQAVVTLLAGFRSMADITVPYSGLAKHGVRVVHLSPR